MLIRIAYRNIWRNTRRTAFCFAAVGIAVLFITIYSSLIGGMKKSIRGTVQVFDLGCVRAVSAQYEEENEYMPVQYPVADGKNWRELAASIKKIGGVRAVFPRINTMATLQESTVKHAVLWGINAADETVANAFNFTDRVRSPHCRRQLPSLPDATHREPVLFVVVGFVHAVVIRGHTAAVGV
jgi:putative ABC transport system permease protein